MREITCIVCPRGCKLTIDGVNDKNIHPELKMEMLKVTGNACPRGNIYGKNEVIAPVRMVTSTIRVNDEVVKRCPVKTSKPIPKELMGAVVAAINNLVIDLPIELNQIVLHDVCNTGADVITTRAWL